MSKKSRLLKYILVAIMLLSTNSGFLLSSSHMNVAAKDINIWSTYNTIKVNRDFHDYDKHQAIINVSMAQGETEGAQIILTPQNKVDKFNLHLTELKTLQGDVLDAEVKVYKQNYLYQPQKSDFNNNYNVPAGYIPDMLLPLDIAIKHNETSINVGDNQGITVEISTTSSTKPGVYLGEYDLIVDESSNKIPVTVTVHDVDITQSNTKTSFILNRIHLMRGEADGSVDMYDKYYKLLLDNKVTATFAPGFDISPKVMAEYIIKYWDNPAFTSYSIPARVGLESYTVNPAVYAQFLRELIEQSTPERNLISRAVCYILSLDEPQDIKAVDGASRVQRELTTLKNNNTKVFNQVVEKGFFNNFDSAFKMQIKNSIDNIQYLITSPYNERFENVDITYVPQFQHFETYDEREALQQHSDKFDNEEWWYGCVSPKYPWPTYHIDDYLQGARAIGWMQKYNKIVGNLYWGVNTYLQWNNNLENNMVMVDPYENPTRFVSAAGGATGVSGDGYLLYPTTKYNSDTPFSSLRLSAIRDGNDDYDLICALEKLYSTLMAEYGLSNVEINDTLQNVFSQLFTQSKYHHDGSLIYKAREVVFDLIAAAKSDAGIVFAGSPFNNGSAEALFYAKSPTATINGEVITGTQVGNAYKFLYSAKLNQSRNFAEAIFNLNEKEYLLNVFLGFYNTKATNFASNSKEGLELSNNSTITVSHLNNNADIIIKSQGDTDIQKRLFKPGFSILNSALGNDVGKLKDVSFTITNKNNKEIKFVINFVAGSLSKEINTFTLKAGESKNIQINNIYLTEWSNLSSFTKIMIYCDNIDSNRNLLPDRMITLSEVYYSVIGD